MINEPLIWITIDSLRKDHTTVYNSESNATPEIASFVKKPDFQCFQHCISHAEWTRSSVGSILTGRHPEQHQVGMELNQAVPSDLPTIAEAFSEAGYDTGCLTENVLIGPELNFDRGFDDQFHIDMTPQKLIEIGKYAPSPPVRYLASLFSESGGLSLNGWEHSLAHLTTMVAKKWIRHHQQSPFFLYLHYNDPHRPYCPPIPERNRVKKETQHEKSPSDYPDFAFDIHDRLYELIAGGIPLSEDEMELLQALYDGEIRHTDRWVGRLLEYILEIIPDAKVVITADHGELFGEGGGLAHKLLLHDTLINVPLITYNFNDLEHQTSELVQHIDIMKTVLGSLETKTLDMEGKNLREDSRSIAISQRSSGGLTRDLDEIMEHNPGFDASSLQPGKLTAFRTKKHKLLVGENTTRLVSLSDEFTDISQEKPDVKQDIEKTASNWFDNIGSRFSKEEIDLSDDMRRHLSDLGYLG